MSRRYVCGVSIRVTSRIPTPQEEEEEKRLLQTGLYFVKQTSLINYSLKRKKRIAISRKLNMIVEEAD